MTYSEGTHIIFTINNVDEIKLKSIELFKHEIQYLLVKYNLTKVGFTEHNFENNGFTLAYCLKESHICIHTWPEYGLLNMDIYLCNYLKDNTQTTLKIYEDFKNYFNGNIIKEAIINR